MTDFILSITFGCAVVTLAGLIVLLVLGLFLKPRPCPRPRVYRYTCDGEGDRRAA